MAHEYQTQLVAAMIIDFAGCYVLEAFWKLFADVRPKAMIAQGQALRAAKRSAKKQE